MRFHRWAAPRNGGAYNAIASTSLRCTQVVVGNLYQSRAVVRILRPGGDSYGDRKRMIFQADRAHGFDYACQHLLCIVRRCFGHHYRQFVAAMTEKNVARTQPAFLKRNVIRIRTLSPKSCPL